LSRTLKTGLEDIQNPVVNLPTLKTVGKDNSSEIFLYRQDSLRQLMKNDTRRYFE
jgi:hypothetical protein